MSRWGMLVMRALLSLGAAAALAPARADACSHHCLSFPVASIVFPAEGQSVPSGAELVLHWKGGVQGTVGLQGEDGSPVEVASREEAWADGQTTTEILTPLAPLAPGVYDLSVTYPSDAAPAVRRFLAFDEDSSEMPTLAAVPAETSSATCDRGHGGVHCCGVTLDYLRIDLDVPALQLITIREGASIVASHAMAPDIWGVEIEPNPRREICNDQYLPWEISQGDHLLSITPIAPDGMEGEAVQVSIAATGGGCSIAHRSRPPGTLLVLFGLGLIICVGRQRGA